MEENINKKNNIQVNALNVGTEKASSKYYSYQNDSTDIIQANTNKFNKNQENSLSSLFQNIFICFKMFVYYISMCIYIFFISKTLTSIFKNFEINF